MMWLKLLFHDDASTPNFSERLIAPREKIGDLLRAACPKGNASRGGPPDLATNPNRKDADGRRWPSFEEFFFTEVRYGLPPAKVA